MVLAMKTKRKCYSYVCIYVYMCSISYNIGKSVLPDIYARCPRACVYIYQAMHECLCYN